MLVWYCTTCPVVLDLTVENMDIEIYCTQRKVLMVYFNVFQVNRIVGGDNDEGICCERLTDVKANSMKNLPACFMNMNSSCLGPAIR